MIIKMIDEFKFTLVHFVRCVCTWIYCWTKKFGKSGLGHRAFALPDLQTAGPSWAVGRGSAFSKSYMWNEKSTLKAGIDFKKCYSWTVFENKNDLLKQGYSFLN